MAACWSITSCSKNTNWFGFTWFGNEDVKCSWLCGNSLICRAAFVLFVKNFFINAASQRRVTTCFTRVPFFFLLAGSSLQDQARLWVWTCVVVITSTLTQAHTIPHNNSPNTVHRCQETNLICLCFTDMLPKRQSQLQGWEKCIKPHKEHYDMLKPPTETHKSLLKISGESAWATTRY